MGKVMMFTDCVGDEFEVRHIVKVSKRGYGVKHYETNDGKWYSHEELIMSDLLIKDNLIEGDIILTRESDGLCLSAKLSHFNLALCYSGISDYNHSEYTFPVKPLPKGL